MQLLMPFRSCICGRYPPKSGALFHISGFFATVSFRPEVAVINGVLFFLNSTICFDFPEPRQTIWRIADPPPGFGSNHGKDERMGPGHRWLWDSPASCADISNPPFLILSEALGEWWILLPNRCSLGRKVPSPIA